MTNNFFVTSFRGDKSPVDNYKEYFRKVYDVY